LTLDQRKARIQSKIEAFQANGGEAEADDDDEDDE
jgi:large subunit ribosomal protein L5e